MKTKKNLASSSEIKSQASFSTTSDSTATDLIKEMYTILKDQNAAHLSEQQLNWISKVEETCMHKKDKERDCIYSLLENAYQYLNKNPQWDQIDKRIYEMLEKIIFLGAQDSAFKAFFENIETVIRSGIQLDFTKKALPPENNLNKRNLLNYVAFSLNMLIEKMKTSVVSMKAVNSMSFAAPGSAVIVTDKKGEIRFVNHIGESLLGTEQGTLLGHATAKLFQEFDGIMQQLEKQAEIKNMKAHLFTEEKTIPVLLNIVKSSANEEDEEIEEIVFMIQPKEFLEEKPNMVFDLTKEAHDKIEPLNSIIGVLQLFKMKFTDERSLKLIDYLENSVNEIKKNAQLTLKSLNAKKTNLKTEPVNIAFIFDSIIESLKYTAAFKEVSFFKDIYHENDLVSNAQLLYSVLQNLVCYSIQHRKAGAEHEIRLTVRDLDASHVLIVLCDNGTGIAAENQKTIFEKDTGALFNIEQEDTGLYLVKESVTKLNGEIEMAGQLYKGLMFSISLPCSFGENIRGSSMYELYSL